MKPAGSPAPALLDTNARWARVTGVKGRFVLFDFTVGDRDLTVELIMPYAAFQEFCADNRATLSVESKAHAEFERLKWFARDTRRIRAGPPPQSS